jgi:hypothetical protein
MRRFCPEAHSVRVKRRNIVREIALYILCQRMHSEIPERTEQNGI